MDASVSPIPACYESMSFGNPEASCAFALYGNSRLFIVASAESYTHQVEVSARHKVTTLPTVCMPSKLAEHKPVGVCTSVHAT